jgi:predicted nicotinamide N-methyase
MMNTSDGNVVIVPDDSADDVRWIEAESKHMEGTCKAASTGNADNADADAEADDDDDDDTPDMGDLFADPDPLDTFHFEYALPPVNTESVNETKNVNETKHTVSIILTGHKAELGQTLHSTGLTLWRASELLCDYMIRTSTALEQKNVLELGAGLGLCGILAHHLQAANVVLTDGDTDALKFMRANVAANCSSSSTSTVGIDSSSSATTRIIQCRQLVWGDCNRVDDLKHQYTNDDNQGFHLVLGSDIIYVEEILDPLFQSVDRLLADSGEFWLAYARRNVKIDLVLETADRYGFIYKKPDDTEGVFIFRRKE